MFLAFESEGPLADGTPTGDSYMLTENWGGAWVDAEKSPTNTEDDLMCWAAAASNILQWTGWGNVAGLATADDVFAYYQDHWTDAGGLMKYGWDWWFDGTNNVQGWSGWSQVDVAGGGFYPSENIWDYYYEQNLDSAAMSAVDGFLRAGYGVTVGLYGPGGHAITAWGVNYNPADPGEYYGLWVSDSDDSKGSTNPPDLLRYYDVSLTGGQWHLQNYYGSNAWYIGTVQALAPNPNASPEEPPPDPAINGVDLWAYAADADSADDALVFTIVGNTDPDCGVTLVDGRYIHVNPVADWFGTSTVTVQASDGELADTDSFIVTVTPVNDAPTIDDLPDQSLAFNESAPAAADLFDYAADVDHPDSSLVFSIVGNTNANCGVSLIEGHILNIVPTTGWSGTSEVTVQVSDGEFAATSTFSVTVNAPQVDLTASFFQISLPASPVAGTWDYAVVRITNLGKATQASYVTATLWATVDGQLDGSGDVLLATSRRWLYLAPGGSSLRTIDYTLPEDMPAGTYRLAVLVDSTDEVSESDETNNQALSPMEYAVRTPAVVPTIDLTGSFVLVNLPTSTDPGTWGYAVISVNNRGVETVAEYVDLELWATADGDLSTGGDDYRIGTARSFVYAQPTGRVYQAIYCVLPPDMPAGNYKVALVVDPLDRIRESNETNNKKMWLHTLAVTGPVAATDVASTADDVGVDVSASRASAKRKSTEKPSKPVRSTKKDEQPRASHQRARSRARLHKTDVHVSAATPLALLNVMF